MSKLLWMMDHSYIVSSNTPSWWEREKLCQAHDSFWGTVVPQDHKLWSTGEKVVLSLFSPCSVEKLIFRVANMKSRFSGFMNDVLSVFQAEKEELWSLSMMLEKHLTTSGMSGNDIPENDESRGVIQQVIANITWSHW